MRTKMKKTYAIIPEDRLPEFMRLVPTARLHAWPSTWVFATNFKPIVDTFLGPEPSVASADTDAFSPPPARIHAPTDTQLLVTLSASQIPALERALKNISAGTIIALSRSEAERESMHTALHALKAALREQPKHRS